ncbi:nucleoporin Nup43 [Drosophila subobscura]|uniref:nucleoporin Nup43 n=1 Tax=Drosophila subobscura TaxID=7241 RepID=UPI00155A7CA4|nr:nucleoporin Nup43 [Drosophila subobscura]
MSFPKVSSHFVSEKISAVRWLPEQLHQSDRFVTSSWDMDHNFVRLYRLQSNQYADTSVDYIPRCNDKVAMEADVTAMEFVDKNTLAVSCADGHLSLMNVQRAVEEDQLQRTARSERLHYFRYSNKSAPCTGLSVYGGDIATVGEDGCVNIMNASNVKQVKRTIEADSMSLLSVCYISQQQLVTANRMGIIRVLDARAATGAQPKLSIGVASEDEKSSNFVSALSTHPMQQHILLCGTEEGSITVWDLRNLECPASYLSAHDSPITDIGFHRKDPSKVFTAAEAGEVWMWTENKLIGERNLQDGSSAWLSGDRVRSLINVDGVLTKIRKSINSFDTNGSRLLCGSDTEAVYLIDNIF